MFDYGMYFYKRLLELFEQCESLKKQVNSNMSGGKDKQVQQQKASNQPEFKASTVEVHNKFESTVN